MRGVRSLLRFGLSVGSMRGCGGWRSRVIEAPPAMMHGLTSGRAGGEGRGAGRMLAHTKRAARGGLKMDAI